MAAPDFVPGRMVNEVLYCERLAYLEWAQGEFADNVYTVDGRVVHTRVDGAQGQLPLAQASGPGAGTAGGAGERDAGVGSAAGAAEASEARPYVARSVWLSSERLGLTAKIDVVEGLEARVTSIEYKRGQAPDVPEGAHLPERAQGCARAAAAGARLRVRGRGEEAARERPPEELLLPAREKPADRSEYAPLLVRRDREDAVARAVQAGELSRSAVDRGSGGGRGEVG